MNDTKKRELEMFEQARTEVQKKIKGRCVTNKDVIIEQQKEIEYYKTKIEELEKTIEGKIKNKNKYDKEIELTIKEEDYLIKYNNNIDTVLFTMYINKIINEPDKNMICKDKEFKIYNMTRINKYIRTHDCYEDEEERIERLWRN